MSLTVGASKTLTAQVLPVGAPQAVVWSTSDDTVAKVSASGAVSGHKAGTADITATATNGVKAICKVTVKATTIPVTGVEFTRTNPVELEIGGTYTLTVRVLPEDATNKNVSYAIKDPTVVKMGGTTGRTVQGLKAGETTITAITEDGGFKTSLDFIVKVAGPPPLTGIALDKNTKLVRVGQQGLGLSVSPVPNDASFEGPATWFSSDAGRLSVGVDGTFDVKATGTVTVTATYGGFKDTCEVTIMVAGSGEPVTGVTTRDYTVGLATQSQTLVSPVEPKDADDLRVEWKVEDPNGVLLEPLPVNTRDRFLFVKRHVGSTEVAGVVKVFAKPLGNPELGFMPCGTLTVRGTKS